MNRFIREFPCAVLTHVIRNNEFVLENMKLNQKLLSTVGWNRDKFITSALKTGFPE